MREIRARYEALKTLPFASIGAAYVGLQDMAGNPASADHPIRLFTILNRTNEDAFFSFDGVNPFLLLPNGQGYSADLCSNKSLGGGFMLPEGTRLYVMHAGVAPTSGAVYWTICYGSES